MTTLTRSLTALSTACAVLLAGQARCEVSPHTMGEFTSVPASLVESVTPQVIVNTSNDHQLYFKAYNDYTDMDGDGALDTTYNHAVDYYGYFDSYKCYAYDSGHARFVPSSLSVDKYCNGGWSGNFLNWASMARIDAVRKILFGGLRSTDTATQTVLERAYLPNDAHAWAKHYDGADLPALTPFARGGSDADGDGLIDPGSTGITLCNTTVNNAGAASEDVSDPPLIRVARGDFSLWAANERWQCRWWEEKSATSIEASVPGSNGNIPAITGMFAADDNPSLVGDGLGDYVARVQACVPGLVGNERCKRYPNGNLKPVGLFQVYGDTGRLLFTTFSGSYTKNKSGGILIKQMGDMANEVDVNGDGHFTATASVLGTNNAYGLINAWSLYRIVGYRHSDGTYGTNGVNANNCTWGLDHFNDGQCMNWGNPFSEIYLNALRFFAGEPISGTFRANDSSTLRGLNTPQVWADPILPEAWCTNMSVINVNASVISYDGDNLDDTSDGVVSIGSSRTSAQLTDTVGAGEGIHGNAYFVGESGGAGDELCTGKSIANLGSARGLCPEAPRLEGTYRLAGLAHYAHTQDLRDDLREAQRVDTYSVALASAVPRVTIPVPGQNRVVHVLPACRNQGVGGNCAIVDFKVVHQNPIAGTGRLYVNWEDSEQGGDFDQDMWGLIDYQVDPVNGTITLTTDAIAESTDYAMGFGYILSGTTQDGFHVHSGIEGFTYTDPTGQPGCANCQLGDGPTSATYTLGASSASLLQDPLWYAAKWGAFEDENGNDIPDLPSEWDKLDQDGHKNPDGIPDTYFFASNPAQLEESLIRVFETILAKAASGTAAAIHPSGRKGDGAVFQALYHPEVKDVDKNKATWIGSLHALWVDAEGLLREDADGDATLDGYDVDPVVTFYYDTGERRTRLRRHLSPDADEFNPGPPTEHDLDDLRPVWDAKRWLAHLQRPDLQRSYAAQDDNERYIFTWIDADLDGAVDSGETVDFMPTEIDASNFGSFDVADVTTARDVVRWVRGEEGIAGLRPRTVDYDGDGNLDVMRLADIVHSTPTPVSTPAESFDLLYSDSSYADFRSQYARRRQVVYVGSNGGMLHAFNAGFYVPMQKHFALTTANGEPPHSLGAELWAYVPYNLLPHLKWLTDPDYSHVYYVDLKPRIFDAKIFSDDAVHPHGWGTVLVVGMRLGGGPMTVDTAANGLGSPNDADDRTFRSAYVVMDITDPESPPEVMAELTLPDLGYTTVYPTALAVRETDGTPNAWYLVFGSGPDQLTTAESTRNAGLYVYDLIARDYVPGYGPYDLGIRNAFMGNPVSVDWDLSFKADAVYFGVIGRLAGDVGRLMKLGINEEAAPGNWDAPVTLIDTGAPVVPTPTVAQDREGTHWVFFGTGRYFTPDDRTSTAAQALYGIKDPEDATQLPRRRSDLLDVTDAAVFTDGTIANVAGAADFDELLDAADGAAGWYIDLPSGAGPAARSFTTSALLGEVLLTSVYQPDDDICDAQGSSTLYGMFYRTGTALDEPTVLGVDTSITSAGGAPLSRRTLHLGPGQASSPTLHSGIGMGRHGLTVILQDSTGTIHRQEAATRGGIRSGEIDWRELRETQ